MPRGKKKKPSKEHEIERVACEMAIATARCGVGDMDAEDLAAYCLTTAQGILDPPEPEEED